MDRESDNETTSRMNRIFAGTTAPRVGFPASLQGLGSILHQTSVASGGGGRRVLRSESRQNNQSEFYNG